MPKRDCNLNVRLSFEEMEKLKKVAYTLGISDSDLVRLCLCLAVPQLEKIPFVTRLRLEDNIDFSDVGKT